MLKTNLVNLIEAANDVLSEHLYVARFVFNGPTEGLDLEDVNWWCWNDLHIGLLLSQ